MDELCNVKIMIDENGYTYYNVKHNVNGIDTTNFTYYIKDAVDLIRQGEGDVIAHNDFLNSYTVRKYISDEYGQNLREKTIAGYADAKFCFSIKHYTSFVSETVTYNSESKLPDFKAIKFDSADDAMSFVKRLLIVIHYYASKAVKDLDNMDDYLAELTQLYFDVSSVDIDTIFYDMFTDDLGDLSIDELRFDEDTLRKKFGLRIVQDIDKEVKKV